MINAIDAIHIYIALFPETGIVGDGDATACVGVWVGSIVGVTSGVVVVADGVDSPNTCSCKIKPW